jgi:excisionase family DNA binding protein
MEGSPEQLSLPLCESDPGNRERPSTPAEEPRRNPRRRVVSSRPLTQATLLTTAEAAELLHVHPRTVQRLVARGQLSAIHLGAAIRFDPADVLDLTDRLKCREAETTALPVDAVRASRVARTSFADRLRSQQDEHRAA